MDTRIIHVDKLSRHSTNLMQHPLAHMEDSLKNVSAVCPFLSIIVLYRVWKIYFLNLFNYFYYLSLIQLLFTWLMHMLASELLFVLVY